MFFSQITDQLHQLFDEWVINFSNDLHDDLGLLWRAPPTGWTQFFSLLILCPYKVIGAALHNSPSSSCKSLGKWITLSCILWISLIPICWLLGSSGLFSSSYASVVVKHHRTPVLSRSCCSSLWMEVWPGDSCRNSSLATAVIRLVWWPWRSHCEPAPRPLASGGGNLLKMDTFTAHGSLIRYTDNHPNSHSSSVSIIYN